MNKVIGFVSEIRAEISKVTWPKRDEVIRLTLIVLFISAVVGGYIGLLDYGMTKALEILVSR